MDICDEPRGEGKISTCDVQIGWTAHLPGTQGQLNNPPKPSVQNHLSKGPSENLTTCKADWDRGTKHGQSPVPQLSDSN